MTDASKPLPFQVIGVGVVLNEAGEVLIDQRLEEGLLGMWSSPVCRAGRNDRNLLARELQGSLALPDGR